MSFKKAVSKMAAQLNKSLRRNVLSEDGRALAEAISEVIAEADNSDDEVTAEELEQRISDAVAALKPVNPDPEKSAEEVVQTESFKRALSLAMANLGGSIRKPAYLKTTNSVKDFARCIHESGSGEEFAAKWGEKLRTNGVTGMAYPEQVESAIHTAWDNAHGLFFALKHVSPREFRIMYSTEDTAAQSAHGHKVGTEKLEQQITAHGKKLSLQMVYKWLPVNRLDMQALDDPETFIGWVTEELTDRVLFAIERAIIGTDVNTVAAAQITSFESIGGKAKADAFTAYYGTATASAGMSAANLFKQIITAALNVKSDGHGMWLFINKTDLGALMTADFNTTGIPIGAGLDTMAARFGVERVVPVDYLPGSMTAKGQAGTAAVIITPDLYYRIGGDVFGDTWTIFEKNQQGYMAEVAAGGGIAGLNSTAVIAATGA